MGKPPAVHLLIQPEPEDRAGLAQQGVGLGVGDPPGGAPVDGRDDVTLADATQRRLATWIHLERRIMVVNIVWAHVEHYY